MADICREHYNICRFYKLIPLMCSEFWSGWFDQLSVKRFTCQII